ncbi:MAG: hypothetical protein QOD83_2144 [Solirubrobacteraceae bacterium]|jgi:hypothetical protein|nr:hypothetical protein [Solirubrobacteraceae bacterium]
MRHLIAEEPLRRRAPTQCSPGPRPRVQRTTAAGTRREKTMGAPTAHKGHAARQAKRGGPPQRRRACIRRPRGTCASHEPPVVSRPRRAAPHGAGCIAACHDGRSGPRAARLRRARRPGPGASPREPPIYAWPARFEWPTTCSLSRSMSVGVRSAVAGGVKPQVSGRRRPDTATREAVNRRHHVMLGLAGSAASPGARREPCRLLPKGRRRARSRQSETCLADHQCRRTRHRVALNKRAHRPTVIEEPPLAAEALRVSHSPTPRSE